MFGALQSQFVFAEDLASILQLSLQQDPVLTEANANTEGAYNDMKASEAGHYPTLSLTGQNVLAQQHTSNNSKMRDDVGVRSRLNLYAWGEFKQQLSEINRKWNIFNINIMKHGKNSQIQ